MGIDTERMKYKGRLAAKREEAKSLHLRIEGDMHAIRNILDPFMPLHEVRADIAAAQAVELAAKHAEYVGLLEEIKAIEKALGD
ncbi:MAG: hypothetical protein OEY01_14615 [Desulfobulbaceae bacterium]|nr:hypothetical protein [Desulfobulbaceae bacterium]